MMNKIRILYIVTGLGCGGAETMLVQLLGKLDATRFEPVVISLLDQGALSDSIRALGIPLYELGMSSSLPWPKFGVRLGRLSRTLNPDVIQGWMYHGNLAAQFSSRLSGKPTCWCIQNSFHSYGAEKILTRCVVRLSSRMSATPKKIVYVSHAARAQHEKIGFDARRSCVIPNGIDIHRFRPDEEARRTVRDELGVDEECILIGLIGRFHRQKDHANFARAAGLLSDKTSNVHFVLAGTHIEEQNDNLTGLFDSSLRGRVHLLGECREMPRLTAALDIATSSSSYGEALSLAVAEAMSCAVPCVVTDVGDSALLVGDTGMVVPPRDPVALANAWHSLIERGQAIRQGLGKEARQRIEQFYGLESVVTRYEKLYSSFY